MSLTRQARPPEGTTAPPPRARAYAQAQRHSRRVRRLRWLIPIGAVIGIGLVVAVSVLDPLGRFKGLSLEAIQLSGTKVTMVAPRLTGQRNNGRGYELTAKAAEQDVRKPGYVELREMDGRVVMDDSGNRAHIKAGFGIFNTAQEQLELSDKVHVRTDVGQEIFMRSASVDFKAGTVVSKEPVSITLTNATVDADTMSVADNGLTMSFVGRVRATFDAPKDAARPPVVAPNAAARPEPARAAVESAVKPLVLVPARSAKAEPAQKEARQ